MANAGSNPKTFQMPSHAWGMIKRIIRAYGASQDNEASNVESVAQLAGIHRPVVSANNNFLRSVGVLEVDKPRLTPLGVKLATGIGLEDEAITTEALEEVVRTTPTFSQLLNTLRARGSMDASGFRSQAILAAGLKADSRNLAMVKTITDLIEESKLVEIRDDRILLVGRPPVNENGGMNRSSVRTEEYENAHPSVPPKLPATETGPLLEILLAKFPQFDPAWSDEVKLKWFDAFDRLMKGRGI